MWVVAITCFGSASACAADDAELAEIALHSKGHVLHIPKVSRPPTLDDFRDMRPAGDLEGQVARVAHFVQFLPTDGAPETERTEAYIAYDKKRLYVIFLCFERDPRKIRVHLGHREDINQDDNVFLYLDTFNDHRQSYVFAANAYGVQEDFIYTETGGYDNTFDTVWDSKARLTRSGYIVWMAIPFKSIRFPARLKQNWGMFFERHMPRASEDICWPWISSSVDGYLNQEIEADGLEQVTPGRNLQFIPYASLRSFRALDTTSNPSQPGFTGKTAEAKVGLDSKVVLKDSLVLDVTANPDFSQVESDAPQVTVNQRFAVFFPEKRPFFQENSNYFATPIDLLFTRNIADPQFGARLTGKAGPYGLGLLFADDRSPGESVAASDQDFGKRAFFTALRVNRDVLSLSNVGMIFTDREFAGTFNRVFGLDGRLRMGRTWETSAQAVVSQTQSGTGYAAGTAQNASLLRVGRRFNYSLQYLGRSPGFETLPGFVNRVDIHEADQNVSYSFFPASKQLLTWGPSLGLSYVTDHTGLRLDESITPGLSFSLQRQTTITLNWQTSRDQLRPVDFPVLHGNEDFSQKLASVGIFSNFSRTIAFTAQLSKGDTVNFVPALHQAPFLGRGTNANLTLTVRPQHAFQIDNTYLLTRLLASSGRAIFNDHILRSKWNYQFTRDFSLRFIAEYNAVLANPALTSLQNLKQINYDVLFTYLVHPGTAVYVGYNSDLQNLNRGLLLNEAGQIQTANQFLNDGRQVFVKVSYLFRP